MRLETVRDSCLIGLLKLGQSRIFRKDVIIWFKNSRKKYKLFKNLKKKRLNSNKKKRKN
jgi:hypothetical protein